MKRKLLAGLLALVMVISMLPVSVFAAEVAVCPGDVDHNLANCPNAIKGETVAPSCGTWGYTLYECPECHEHFADDFKPYANEEHTLKEIEAEIKAECGKEGKTAVTKCEVCEKTFGGEVIPALQHKWDDGVSKDGVITYTCELCGETTTEVCDHEWITPPVIKLEPTLTTAGIAVYTCDKCGITKEVSINPLCGHGNVKKVSKEATCTEAGLKEHYKCNKCGMMWEDKDQTKQIIDADSLVIKAKDHNFDINKGATVVDGTLVDSTCDKTGTATALCANGCGTKQEITIAMKEHSFGKTPVYAPKATCTTWGYKLYACTLCGFFQKDDDRTAPLGHTPRYCPDADGAGKDHDETKCDVCKDAALSENVAETVATCEKDGKWTWNCGRCQEEQTEIVKAEGHNTVVAEYDAVCHRYGYTVTYCTNENCDYDSHVINVIDTAIEFPVPLYTNGSLDALGESPYDLDVVPGKVYKIASVFIDAAGGLNPDNHTRDNVKSHVINWETCTEDGNEVFYCAYCDYYAPAVRPATGHDFDLTKGATEVTAKSTPASCGKNAVKVIKCADCDVETSVEQENTALTHRYEDVVVYPTCKKEGYTASQCSLCGDIVKTTLVVLEIPAYKIEYSWEEAGKESFPHNIDLNNPAYKEIRGEDPCTQVSLYHYVCPDCNKGILVVREADHAWELVAEKVEPDCTNPGSEAYYECANCDATKGGEPIEALGHTKKVTKEAKAATCTEDGWTEASICAVCGKNEVQSVAVKATGHWRVPTDSATQTCTQFGYEHRECSKCDYEFIWKYKAALGHDYKVINLVEATCKKSGSKTEQCANCGDKHTELLLKLPHQNAAGEILTGKCTDTAVDTCCVNGCFQCLTKNHSQSYITGTYFEPTCQSHGYTLHFCEYCGANYVENDKDDIIDPSEVNHTWIMDRWGFSPMQFVETEATLHNAGSWYYECELCGYKKYTESAQLNGITLTPYIENTKGEDVIITYGSEIKITVTVDANKVDMWGYSFSLTGLCGLEFLKADFSNSVFNSNNYTTSVEAFEDKVVVTGSLATSTNKTVDEELVLVELYFQVVDHTANYAMAYVNDTVILDRDGAKVVDAANYIYAPLDEALVDVDMYSDEYWTIMEQYVAVEGYDYVDVAMWLDANGDYTFDLVDCQNAFYIFTGEMEFNPVVDVDFDGELTLNDLQALFDLYVGNIEIEDLLLA